MLQCSKYEVTCKSRSGYKFLNIKLQVSNDTWYQRQSLSYISILFSIWVIFSRVKIALNFNAIGYLQSPMVCYQLNVSGQRSHHGNETNFMTNCPNSLKMNSYPLCNLHDTTFLIKMDPSKLWRHLKGKTYAWTREQIHISVHWNRVHVRLFLIKSWQSIEYPDRSRAKTQYH